MKPSPGFIILGKQFTQCIKLTLLIYTGNNNNNSLIGNPLLNPNLELIRKYAKK